MDMDEAMRRLAGAQPAAPGPAVRVPNPQPAPADPMTAEQWREHERSQAAARRQERSARPAATPEERAVRKVRRDVIQMFQAATDGWTAEAQVEVLEAVGEWVTLRIADLAGEQSPPYRDDQPAG